MINTIYLALGSNLGDRENYLQKAVSALEVHDEIEVSKLSSFYETEAVSEMKQPNFLNAAAELKTVMDLRTFFQLTVDIEKQNGRLSKGYNDPRTCDIDILFFNDVIVSDDDLVIPHPLLHERSFVLEPLTEIAADVIHPIFNKSVYALSQELLINA